MKYRPIVFVVMTACVLRSGGTASSQLGGVVAGSSGGTSSAGSGGESSAGTGDGHPGVGPLAPVIASCDGLAGSVGEWQNITPAELKVSQWCVPAGNATCPGAGNVSLHDVLGGYSGKIATYGAHYMTLDPVNVGTVYMGTSQLGIWKSTDCGATWAHINNPDDQTSGVGFDLDQGRNWTIVVDPQAPNIVYTTSGYNTGGVYQSLDGGATWTSILTDNVTSVSANGFVEKITLDPDDHTHLIVSFHTSCSGTPIAGAATDGKGGWACLASGKFSGSWTWTMLAGGEPWAGTDGPGQTVVSKSTWFYGSNGDGGLWRTTNADDANGPIWTKVYPGASIGGIYVASDKTFFSGAYNGDVNHSATGDLGSWTQATTSVSMTSVNGSIPMADDGTTLYVSRGTYGPQYFTAPLSAPTVFTPMPGIPASMTSGGSALGYDIAHHILYSSNMTGGMWRLVTQ